MTGLLARLRSLVRSLHRRSTLDAEMSEEFRHHIELRTRDLIHAGLSRRAASRRAHREFGHVESHKEEARAARGLRWLDQTRFSWIDVKLGARMLLKHPLLTLVALFALGIGIPVGLAPWQFFHAVGRPLPVPEGDRIRAMRYYDVGPSGPVARDISPYEFEAWRDELSSFSELGAYRTVSWRVATGEGAGRPVSGAEVTANAFQILRTPAFMGRTLDAADELAGAPAVVVVSHEIWRTRLGGVADVVGRTIGIAGVPHVVVGVMPVGFHFPTREHLWTSMRDAPATGPADGRPLRMFGRLADGVTEEAAQLQADGLGRRMAEAHPGERANWRLEVARFGIGASGFPKRSLFAIPQLYVAELAALLLLLVACSNVAILVFARGAARLREIAVRTALGASRPRIVSQMFAESLILTLLATSLGLLASDVLFGRLIRAVIVSDGGVGVPYWMDLGVTPAVVAAALVLAALSAGFAGILPALRITRGDVHPTIQRVASGSGGIRFGTWTAALIALDVALAVVAVGFVTLMSNRLLDVARSERLVGVAADEYLAVQVDFAPDPSLPETDTLRARQRLETMERALVERLQGDPRVRAVAVASRLPRMEHPMSRIEVDGAPSPIESGEVHVVRADVGYFGAFETPILAGRGFDRGDLERGVRAAVVNTAFVDGTLGGANPLGRRIRFLAGAERDDGTWHEIVGVVGPLGINVFLPDGGEAVYLPAPPGSLQPLRLAIHVGAAPESFASTLREIVSEVDPLATTNTPRALSRVQSADWYLGLLVQGLVTLLVAVLLSLAVTGLYAVLSFAVSQRMREIGIRTALGAGRDAIALAIARRALLQIGLGALIGTPVVLWMFVSLRGYAGLESGVWTTLAALFPGILVVALVSLLACAAPVARALRVSPNEVLKTEG